MAGNIPAFLPYSVTNALLCRTNAGAACRRPRCAPRRRSDARSAGAHGGSALEGRRLGVFSPRRVGPFDRLSYALLFRTSGADMKTQVALFGCLMLACNVAIANVDCDRAPYGESVGRYGRDEFQLGILSVMHNGSHPGAPRAMIQKIDEEMRAACLAKFKGENLPRYARLALPPQGLATETVGSIAAAALHWNEPPQRGSASVPAVSGTARVPVAVERAAPPVHYMRMTSDFSACPRRVDLKRLLAAALIGNASWPEAEAVGKRHGCIELHAGDRVERVGSDRWAGVIRVRPAGRTAAYWTDAMVVR